MGRIQKAANSLRPRGVSNHGGAESQAKAAEAEAELEKAELAEAETKVAEEQAAAIARALQEDEAHRQAELHEVAEKEAEAMPDPVGPADPLLTGAQGSATGGNGTQADPPPRYRPSLSRRLRPRSGRASDVTPVNSSPASSLANSSTASGYPAASAAIRRDTSGSSSWFGGGGQQLMCGFVRKGADSPLREPLVPRRVPLSIPDCEQHPHPIGVERPRDESEHCDRSPVQPLGIVDQAKNRAISHGSGNQRERRQAHQEPVRRRTGRQPNTEPSASRCGTGRLRIPSRNGTSS
jgi:hypothetical protein